MKAVFFRDDDLGWEHAKFLRLLELFQEFDFKLNAEAIPLEARKLFRPGEFAGCRRHLEVHSHGFSHSNHENVGHKAEFGRQRDPSEVRRELAASRALAGEMFGDLYFPAFTPPWNWIEEQFIPLLVETGFKVLSRDGATRSRAGILELNVELDLHTDRKHPGRRVEELVQLIGQSSSQRVGIMLHHGRMTDGDYLKLRELLATLKTRGARSLWFSEILGGRVV